MSDKYVINGYEVDAEDFDEDLTEIIDEQAEGDEIDEIAKDAAPLGNATLVSLATAILCFYFFCNLFMRFLLTNHKLHILLNV